MLSRKMPSIQKHCQSKHQPRHLYTASKTAQCSNIIIPLINKIISIRFINHRFSDHRYVRLCEVATRYNLLLSVKHITWHAGNTDTSTHKNRQNNPVHLSIFCFTEASFVIIYKSCVAIQPNLLCDFHSGLFVGIFVPSLVHSADACLFLMLLAKGSSKKNFRYEASHTGMI